MSDNFDFLDQSVEQLVDMPEYKPFPAGTYLWTFGYEPVTDEETDKVTGIKLEMTMAEVIELANKNSEEVVEPGKKLTTVLNTVKKDGDKNEFAEGTIKMVAALLKERFNGATIRDILDAASGCQFAGTISLRKYKDKQTGEQREQNQLKEVAWHD